MLKRVLFLFMAVLAAGGTFVMVKMNKAKPTAQTPVQVVEQKQEGPKVLVAAKTLPAGTFVTNENLKWQVWPEGSLSDAYLLNKDGVKKDDFAGAVVRRAIVRGEPLTKNRIVKPGDRGFAAAILREGMRAVSVNVNAMTGIAGLVFPGDHVDVILTHSIRRPDDEERPMRQVSETILQNVRVLAMDQRTDDQSSKPSVPKTATLEVSPKQAEILMVSTDIGRLSLSLRALPDTPNENMDMTSLENTDAVVEPSKEGNSDAVTAGFKKELSNSDKTKIAKATPKYPEPLKESHTFTMDGEASRLLSGNMVSKKVSIYRGSEKEDVVVGGNQ